MTTTVPSTRDDLLARRTEILERLSDPSALTPEDVTALTTEAEQVRVGIDTYNAATVAAEQARAALLGTDARDTITRPGTAATAPAGADTPPADVRPGSVRVLESDAFTEFRSRGYSGQATIDLPGNVRTLVDNSPTSAGAWQNPQRPTEYPQLFLDRTVHLADLIDRRPTDSNTVEYVQETTTAGAGSTAAETAEGALKPEATFTFTVITDSVRTIAHWINITRQSADDNSQMRGYIEGRLAYGLEYRLDAQIIGGNGTAPNLRGILNTSGTGVYVAAAAEAAILSVRKAITVAQGSEYSPDTLVLNPIDWERIEISTDTNGMFRVTPNVAGALAPRVWGLNVVPTTAITGTVTAVTGGRFIVGSFRMGATLWERDGIKVLMTDSHASNFTSNILTLLAEMRAALSVWRPKAFVVGTFGATGN